MKFHALIFTLLFSLTLHAECLNNNTSSFLDNLFKANCSECSCMTASFSDELKPEKSNLDNKINNQVKELVNTKIELLIGNMAKLDSFMQIENNSLPDVSTCSLTSLEQKLNCPNLEKMILKKGLGSKKNFLNQIGKKFAALQDVNSNNSCIGQDALNYLVAKKSISATDLTEGTLAPIAKITDETSLREFREAYYSKISSVPILY